MRTSNIPVRMASAAAVVLALSLSSQAAAAPPVDPPGPDPDASAPLAAHYSGNGLFNPLTDFSAPLADTTAEDETELVPAAIGDAGRFNTWSGYPGKEFMEAVTTGDSTATARSTWRTRATPPAPRWSSSSTSATARWARPWRTPGRAQRRTSRPATSTVTGTSTS